MAVNPDQWDEVVAQIEKKYGKGNIHLANTVEKIDKVPTGSLELDFATGGGIPMGRFTRLYGGPSSGKTLACWNIIREAQAKGLDCVYYNIEKQFDRVHVERCGVDIDKLHVVEGTTIEEIATKAEALMSVAHMHVFDSCSQAVSIDELNAKPEDWFVGLGPRAWGKTFRRLNDRLDNDNVMVYVDHARVVFGSGAEAPPGGKAMEHASSMTLHFKRGKWLGMKNDMLDPDGQMIDSVSDGKDPYGMEIQVRCEKSRVSQPFRTARMRIGFHDYKYDYLYEYAKAAKWLGMAQGKSYMEIEGEEKKVHGIKNLRLYIEEHPKFREEIRRRMNAQS